jgi:hypothetical protein
LKLITVAAALFIMTLLQHKLANIVTLLQHKLANIVTLLQHNLAKENLKMKSDDY